MSSHKVRAFGITKDIIGGRETVVEGVKTVGELRAVLRAKYPDMTGLRSLFVAVNQQYADDTYELKAGDEIALIPPVSGG